MKAKLKELWLPRWLKNLPKTWRRPQPTHDPAETNHQRALSGQQRRAALYQERREADRHE